MIKLFVALLALTASVQPLWFRAFHKSKNMPFCFVDFMTEEKDYVIKWDLDQPLGVDEDEPITLNGHGEGGSGVGVEEDPNENKRLNYLYFNITSFSEQIDETTNQTKKVLTNTINFSTEQIPNKTEGVVHFTVENSRHN